MQIRNLIALLMFPAAIAAAQKPIALMPNAISICTESQACVITNVTDPNAVFQFGAGTTWCQTFNTPKVPVTVNYIPVNPTLCSYDPASNTEKTLMAQQRNTTYMVTYTLDGKIQPVKTIPGLLVLPVAVSTFPALCINYSDTTFSCTATGPVTPVAAK